MDRKLIIRNAPLRFPDKFQIANRSHLFQRASATRVLEPGEAGALSTHGHRQLQGLRHVLSLSGGDCGLLVVVVVAASNKSFAIKHPPPPLLPI